MDTNKKTIVLLGFSTTGKSSILKILKERRRLENVDFIDTDQKVAEDYGGHIYNVFIKLFDRNDPINRNSPLKFIEESEEKIIFNLCNPTTKNRLIACGPFLPTRKNFNDFITTQPEFIFLKTDTESVYNGLIYRHNSQKKEGLDKYSFGCWDLGVTKYYNGKRYVLLPKDDALKNIKKLLDPIQEKYKRLAKDNEFDSIELNKFSKSFNKYKYDNFITKIENKLNGGQLSR